MLDISRAPQESCPPSVAELVARFRLHRDDYRQPSYNETRVRREFLNEIESWRDALARNVALRNPRLSARELNYAVTKTIDRIIFLRMCEDRGVETYAQLRTLLNGPNVYPRLVELLRRADERYNSGLFHFRPEKGRDEAPDELTPGLTIDDKVLKGIIQRLYYPQCPYEFSVMPPEILGQVYEQFLGKVITLTAGHRAKIELKPEVRKAGGVYYTPRPIVDYIVERTIGKLLEGKTPADLGPAFDQPARGKGARKEAAGRRSGRERQAGALRILDPACGSGSFLLGAYQYLLDWRLKWYSDSDPRAWARRKGPPIYQSPKADPTIPGPTWRLTVAERKRILLNNIYGVDIDPQAVEVTKLSLLLKVLEGETQQTLEHLFALHERALPDLGQNIKCGNSLIGPDFYEDRQIDMFDEDERYRVNAFDWHDEFQPIMETGGFDAVIGNPPYGYMIAQPEQEYLRRKYTGQTYQLDNYQIFMERCLCTLVRPKGYWGMIIPNPWLTNVLQKSICRLVFDKSRVLEIVHFKRPVFRQATVDTEIVILRKDDPAGHRPVAKIVPQLDSLRGTGRTAGIQSVEHDQDAWRLAHGEPVNIFSDALSRALLDRLRRSTARLDAFCAVNVGIKPYQQGKGKPPQTASIVASRPFDATHRVDSTYRPILRGADIRRYLIAPLEERYLSYGPWLAEPRPAAKFDAPAKIVMRQTGDSLIAALDLSRRLCMNNTHVIVPHDGSPDILIFLALVNSRLLAWYYHELNPEKGEALAEVKRGHVAQLPVPLALKNADAPIPRHHRLMELSQCMLNLHDNLTTAKAAHEKTMIQRQIEGAERQIDQLVYGLYDLTEDEVRIVEERGI